MEFVESNVEGHTRPAVTAAKLPVMETSLVLSATSLAKSVAIIQNVARCAMSLAYLAQRIVPGLVRTAGSVYCRVQYRAICCRAQRDVKIS